MINLKMLKKTVISFLAAIILLVSIFPYYSQPARAQTWYDQGFDEWFVKVYDDSNPTEIFGERYTAGQVQWVVYSLFSFIIPSPLKPVLVCFFTGDVVDCGSAFLDLFAYAPGEQDYYAESEPQKTLFAVVFEERPFSGITYIKDSLRKFHLVPEAKAQTGFGFEGLSVVRELWKASRNIAYFFFVIAIIVMAFMIMFRVKISPQTVISVQSSLPKIAIALVLITFSYAIAGFMVDLMYVVIGVLSLLIANSGQFLASNPVSIFEWLTQGTIQIPIIPEPALGIGGMLLVYLVLFTFVLFFTLMFGGGLLGFVVTAPLWPAMLLVSVLAAIVVYIMLVFISIKIFIMLIKTFASILLLTIVAPFQIAAGIFIPSVGFGSWAKNFLGHLAVFPLVGLMITVAYIFLIVAFRVTYGTTLPDVLSFLDVFNVAIEYDTTDGWPPLLGVGGRMMGLALIGVSLATLFALPRAADIIKGIISGRAFPLGTAIGEAFGPISGGYSRAMGFGPIRAARRELSEESAAGMFVRARDFAGDRKASRGWQEVYNILNNLVSRSERE